MEAHFIGSLHNDPDGYSRTLRGLEKLKPDVIALEWEGPEYEAFLNDPRVKALRVTLEDAIREVFRECGIDPALYDETNAKVMWRGEVKAAKDFAQRCGIPVFPTESSTVRIATDIESLEDLEGARVMYRGWLAGLKREGRTYNPDEILAYDPSLYEIFERHLDGKVDPEEAKRLIENSTWAYRPERVRHQVDQLHTAVQATGEDDRLVHIGGLLHLLDDNSERDRSPLNLWQHASTTLSCKTLRHSLSHF